MLHKSTDKGTVNLGLKSRIPTINTRIWSVIAPMLFVAFGLFGVNESAWGNSATELTVKIAGSGSIKVNTSSSQPSGAWSTSTVTKSQDHWSLATYIPDTYYIWVNPSTSDGYYCSGVSGNDVTISWDNSGYYVVVVPGSISRTSPNKKTVTVNFVKNFYSKAEAHAVPSTVGKVTVGVRGSNNQDGQDSRGWVNPGTANTYDWTYVAASSAPTYSYHFYKQDPTGYAFDGWYSNEACTILKTSNADFWEPVTATTTEQTDLEYWAHWTAKPYIVTLNKHNGESNDTVSVTYDSNANLTSNVAIPTKTGYIFGGYYTGENGTGTQCISANGAWQAASGFIVDGKWKNAGDVTLHAKWTPITYYVAFNGNNSTSGSMSNQTFTYDVAQNLTTNAFDRPGFRFDGWNTAANGSGASYTNGQSVVNLTSTHNKTVNLFAKWIEVTVNSLASNGAPTTAPLSFTKPESKTATVVFNVSNADGIGYFNRSIEGAGWTITNWTYSSNQVTITVQYTCTATTAQGQHTAIVTLTSKAAGALPQTATVAANVDLTPSLSVSPASKAFGEFTLAKDPVQTQAFTFTFDNNNSSVANVVMVTAPTAPFSASWTASTTNTKTLTVSFNPAEVGSWNQEIIVEARNSQTPYIATPCTISVSGSAKRNEVAYTCTIESSYLVEDANLNLATLWTSNNNEIAPAYEIVSFEPSGVNNEGAHEPQITGTTLSLGQAGTLVLKVSQPQTTSFNKKEETKTITINKRPNEIKTYYKWKDNNNAFVWSRSLGFEDGAYVQFRSNNMEAGAPSIIVRQIEGEDVATFFPDSVTNDVNGDAFYTSFTIGTAKWKVSQPENYKYDAAAERQFNLSVGESDMTCDVYTQTWSGEKTVSQIGEIDLGGVGETLYFEMKRNGTVFGDECLVYTYVPGRGWDTDDEAEEFRVDISWAGITGYDSGHEKALPEGTTKIKILKSGADNPYVNNIHVTRKRWMKLKATADANATISSLAKLERKVGTAAKTATFYVDFSTCSERVKVASNHGNVTFANGLSKDTISTDHSAIVPVTIHYSSDTIESKMVTITVYTEDKNATLTIPVQTTGIETELVYIGEVSYPVDNANIAATSLFEVREKGTTTVVTGAAITIAKSGVSDAANVVENALEPLCGNKTVNLTASFAGDNRHEPSSLATPQAITIDKIADAVSFNSHPVVIIGKSYDISAWASAHTALTFESGDDDIFSIDGTTLRAYKVGTTTLKATAAGNECTYLSGAFNTESITVQPGYIFNGNNDNQWEEESNWENGEKPTIDDDVIIRGNLVIDEEVEVKSLTIENTGNVTLTVNGSLTVGSGNSIEDLPGGYGNLHVENGGEVNLTTGQLNVNNFTLDANLGVTNENVTTPSTSGQVKNENMLNVSGDAYFRLALDPSGHSTYGWYDFVVPFPVDVIGGISVAEDPTAVMRFNVNYAVMAYDEAKNAQRGKHWNKFSGTLQPGRAYTITLDDDYPWNTVVFKKKAGADVTGNRTFTTEYSGLGAETQYNGWNGLGNGTLHHAELDVPANAVIQLYDHTHKCYQPRAAKDYSLAVGLAFFMQFNGVQMVTLQNADGNAEFRAPRRAMNDVENFRLALTAEDAVNPADYIWVSASEDATGEYVIGRDVTKMGTISESTVARMWTQRSGMTLCSNEMPLVDDIAQCELGLYAPQARTYTIAIEEAPEDADLYLTYNGQIIWNLTAGAYTIDLAKGTTSGYGLRVEARAPQITTGVENTTIDGKSARKVLINNIIYIVTPEGEMYDLMGKSVK